MESMDELTGVYPRTVFLEKLDQALVACAQDHTVWCW
jgi:PleD family two-component response regulator